MKQLKTNLRRVALALLSLFVLLTAYASYSLTTYGNRWFASSANTLVRQQKKNVIAGDILDRNGVLLATTKNSKRVYQQDAAARAAVVHVVGDTRQNVNNGVESFMASYLYGFHMSFFERASATLAGAQRQGDSVTLTIDSALMRLIASLFPEGKSGAVVVMNYKTGEILALQSFPNFDPDNVTDLVKNNPKKPFYNRAVQGLYAPGSTFKVVTTASALKNIKDATTRAYQCTGMFKAGESYITDAGTDLANNKITSHGQLSLLRAFQVSCNNTFAQIAVELTDAALRKTAEDFGFNENFLFGDLVVENSSYPTVNRTERELAWTGAGQSALVATPLHMCLIASGIANGGEMAEPMLLLRATASSGKTRYEGASQVFKRAVEESTAAQIKEYMRAVVTGGTGTAAAVPGHIICAKTGSAEKDGQEDTNAWFIGFIDEESAPYALSIIVEDAGGGGAVAAPIAKKIFQRLLEGN